MTIRSSARTRRRFPSASPPTVAKRPALSDLPRKRFTQLYNRLIAKGHTSWKVFGDFCEMAAMSLANGIVRCDEREAKYMAVVRRYTHPELDALCEMLGCVVVALDHEVEGQLREHGKPAFPRCDFLGSLFMELGLASHWKKQFFTPYALCEVIARMTFSPEGLRETIQEHGFVPVAEPACGAGAMVIAFASAMLQEGLNPQQQLHVTAIDLDQTAAYMAFIQLSILGIPATVYVGNSLTGRMHEVLHTPFYHRGLWEWKLRKPAHLSDAATLPGRDRGRDLVPEADLRDGALHLARRALLRQLRLEHGRRGQPADAGAARPGLRHGPAEQPLPRHYARGR